MPKRTTAAILRRTAGILLVLLIVIAGLWLAGRELLLLSYGPNALEDALKSRDVEQVEFLLLLGADPNKPDGTGTTPLAQVLSPHSRRTRENSSAVELTRVLLQHGADPNQPDGAGATPLAQVLGPPAWQDENALSVVELLLEHGADPEGTTTEGYPFLFFAMKNRPLPFVQALLDAGADPNIRTPDGVSALSDLLRNADVAHTNRDARVQALINAGTDVGPWEAVLLGDIDRLNEMIKNDPGIVDRPLYFGRTPLFAAAYNADTNMVRFLLGHGANPNARSDSDATPLHASLDAAYLPERYVEERAEVVDLLLEAGAQPNLTDQNGFSALHIAAMHGIDTTMPGLLNAGADALLADTRGFLPIAWVRPHFRIAFSPSKPIIAEEKEIVRDRVDRIFELLMNAGSPANVQGPNESSPLLVAAQYASPRTLRRMLDLAADTNGVAGSSRAPLHVATAENTRVLLEYGADVDIRSAEGETPLLWTLQWQGDPEKVQILLNAGANIRMNDFGNTTPIEFAKWTLSHGSRNTRSQQPEYQEAARLILEAAGIDPAELE